MFSVVMSYVMNENMYNRTINLHYRCYHILIQDGNCIAENVCYSTHVTDGRNEVHVYDIVNTDLHINVQT